METESPFTESGAGARAQPLPTIDELLGRHDRGEIGGGELWDGLMAHVALGQRQARRLVDRIEQAAEGAERELVAANAEAERLDSEQARLAELAGDLVAAGVLTRSEVSARLDACGWETALLEQRRSELREKIAADVSKLQLAQARLIQLDAGWESIARRLESIGATGTERAAG
ncbi:MAG TPA: hypothetical protein VH306_06410 [Gaiellaceae bacterium]|jgi:phage protein D